jgi:hypothetical protein
MGLQRSPRVSLNPTPGRLAIVLRTTNDSTGTEIDVGMPGPQP